MVKKDEKFIIGLGNPGKEYIYNRHNIGFMIVENFSKKYNANFTLKNKLKSLYCEFQVNNITYRLFMPNTFMNNSGEAVKSIIDWYKIDLEQMLIILDDIDLPLGKIRYRKKGGSGGHNGLKSIINHLKTENFNRIRIGIGSPLITEEGKTLNIISHVLGNFSLPEKLILDKIFLELIKSLENLNINNEENIICRLNSYNNKKI